MKYCNAGHNVCPFVFSNTRFDLLRAPGFPISSWIEEPDYCDRTIDLMAKDRIFLYTDGIIELRNKSGEQYGEERLLEVLTGNAQEPETVLNRIISNACEFAGLEGTLQIPDDITMVLIEVE
jgi:sigma-B regulation protein RsbU (phosphoserine phosphatase)